MKIHIEKLNQTPVCEQKIEMVERKGIGHPDSLADAICEASSRIVSNYYIEKKGFICHHNLDKGLLVGGVSNPVFGGGEIIERPDAIVAGTATIIENIDDIKKQSTSSECFRSIPGTLLLSIFNLITPQEELKTDLIISLMDQDIIEGDGLDSTELVFRNKKVKTRLSR